MIPLLLFLLACAALYVGTVQTAFSVLMRLPLRLNAERHGQPGLLGHYLEEPARLFVTAGVLQAVTVALVTTLALLLVEPGGPGMWLGFAGLVVFVLACGHVLPLLVVRRNPEQVLTVLLPSFHAVAGVLRPVTGALADRPSGARPDRSDAHGAAANGQGGAHDAAEGGLDSEIDERAERQLLQSVVEFGDTVVREVMTPRPDIVAVQPGATLAELRDLFVDQQYSRLPVYQDDLDNILGFVFVKDLVALSDAGADERVVERLLRPVYSVPEAKRVAALLKEFQRQQVQIAIVHDEYGGTAGLVTIEDLLEEIVGEIRDEYDVEAEPIVDEGGGSYVFSGTVGVDDMAERLAVEVERQGFETVGGYLLARLGRVPRVGETLVVDRVDVEILDGEERRIQRVRMRRRPESVSAAAR